MPPFLSPTPTTTTTNPPVRRIIGCFPPQFSAAPVLLLQNRRQGSQLGISEHFSLITAY
ncbi:MAG: hypothetical protein JNJ78_13160 [Anaerolineae bacterium]|nr:hypothetical protein [Anaerolineae bacterium]